MVDHEVKYPQNFEFSSHLHNRCKFKQNGIRSSNCRGIDFIKIKSYDFRDNKESLENIKLAQHIANKLLTSDYSQTELSTHISQKIKIIEKSCKNVPEEFSEVLNKWLKMRKETIRALKKTEQQFRLINRTTAGLTLLSSTAEIATSIGLILKNIFRFKIDLPLLIVPILSGISVTSSILALSYSRTVLKDITEGLRDEKHKQRDLDILYHKGKGIDKAVQDLFPFGVDLGLLKDSTVEKLSWKHHVCSAIILTNIKKDREILDDLDFLPTVKAFVESPAAQIWFNRMKLRKLLDIMSYKCEKEIKSSSEVFLNRAAINLYPVFLPLWTKTGSTEKMQFLFSSIAAIKTGADLLDSGSDEFQEVSDTVLALNEEYVKIRKLNSSLISDYD